MEETGSEEKNQEDGEAVSPFQGPSSLPPPKVHYDSVKMKYFASLGMNKPPPNVKRERGQTTPLKFADPTHDLSEEDKAYLKPISPSRPRSVSTPIGTTKGIPIPGKNETLFQFDSDEEFSGEEKQSTPDENSYRGKFIPPHEMIAKGGFEVGTARSLAVWESQRRKRMNDVSD